MTRLRLFSRNSVRAALNSLIFILVLFFSGCSSSTSPTYLKENLETAIQNICKNEYNIDVTARRVGSTLWIYMPAEDVFVKAEKPQKYTEEFEIENNNTTFQDSTLNVQYAIKGIPKKEGVQEYQYNKKILEKTNNVWKVLRRVLFSMSASEKNQPEFFVLVTADIKNGFELAEIFYSLDFKKVSYGYISWDEYQHRAISQTEKSPLTIGDKTGLHLAYRDITLREFIDLQIQHRIKLKFQKPEVGKNADIDKEVQKIIAYTLKTYKIDDFEFVTLNNTITKNKIILNRAAILASSVD